MANISKEIHITTGNAPGTLAKVTAPIKDAGVNVRAFCAWGKEDESHFMIVTEDNDKAAEALQAAGFDTRDREVVLLDLNNEIGTLDDAAQKLGTAGVNIDYCYVSTSGSQCLAVFSTQDNAKAAEVL
jgi:hypothetical protein